jgi:hypothetical protein
LTSEQNATQCWDTVARPRFRREQSRRADCKFPTSIPHAEKESAHGDAPPITEDAVMDEILGRIWEDLQGRIHGPMSFRFILQPLMATIFAIRDGFRDAQTGQPAYFWSLCSDPRNRRERLRHGWKAVSRIFVLGAAMDIIFQLIVFRWIYPGEVLIVAATLAILPYVLLRGPVKRLAEHWVTRRIPAS